MAYHGALSAKRAADKIKVAYYKQAVADTETG
jgi:hypothetical protein